MSSIDKPNNLDPRLSWDDIVNGAKSLYSQAMATPTSTTIEASSSTSTAAAHGDLDEGKKVNDNNTQFKKGKGWESGSNLLERRGLVAGAGAGLVVLGLFG